MWPILISFAGVAVPWWVLTAGVGILLTSFFWWRSMRLDFEEERIFGGTIGLVSLIGLIGLIEFLVIKTIKIEMGGLWILGLGFWWWLCFKNKWDYWEWLDLLVPTGLLFGVGINLSIGTSRFVYAAGYFLVWIINRIIAKNYRKMKWYLSGRIGISGLAGILFWSLFQMVVEIWSSNGIYWVGLTIGQWVSVLLFTVSITVLYIRSERKILKDLPFFGKAIRK